MLIFLLQNLEFSINNQKTIADLTLILEFVGVLLDSPNMTLSLSQEKVEKMNTQCKELLEKSLVTVRELSKLIKRLSSIVVAVLSALLQYKALQQ